MRNLLIAFVLMASPAWAASIEITVAGQANGVIVIELDEQNAPKHAARIKDLAASGEYDNVVFHRVIEGFMAQTGDVRYGKAGGDMSMAGRGGSQLPNLDAEFARIRFERGIVGMARSASPNSANSQFFIMFAESAGLNGQYTVIGKVTSGMEVVDQIKRGAGPNGMVVGEPDRMVSVRVLP